MIDSKITAKIILDSICPTSKGKSRLITVQTTSPKWLDAEIEKHRMLSSNSSSSRALPVKAQLDAVATDPYIPQDVRHPEKGMQGHERIEHPRGFELMVKDLASQTVSLLKLREASTQYHKQHVNRYLEPFSIQSKVITGNYEAFQGMLKLRMSKFADPAIQRWAEAVDAAIKLSEPQKLGEWMWHLPYIDIEEMGEVEDIRTLCLMSAARCAKVSYKNEGNTYPIAKEVKFAERLLRDQHMSPFEHQAKPFPVVVETHTAWPDGMTALSRSMEPLSGNLKHWVQFRQTEMSV